MADAPKINPTDTLRESYPKLNQAIDNANEALRNSEEALNTANQALANSENTQAQLDQIVIEGDSSVEAAQARVDAEGNVFTTLKERLDTKETQFATDIEQRGINIKTEGAKGDGSNDLPSIISSISKGKEVIIPDGSFTVTNELPISTPVKLTGKKGNKIISSNTTANGDVSINANDVILENIELDGKSTVQGIYTGQVKRVEVKDSKITSAKHAIHINAANVEDIDIVSNDITAESYAILINQDAKNGKNINILFNKLYSRTADGIELNNPSSSNTDTWKQAKIIGNTIIADEYGSNANSGFAIGIAKTRDVVVIGNLVEKSRLEALHIEDDQENVVVTGNVFNGCMADGARVLLGGYSGTGKGKPVIVSNNHFIKHGISKTGNGIYRVYDPSGQLDSNFSNNYIRGFNVGLWMDGKGFANVSGCMVEDCNIALKAGERSNIVGTVYSNNTPILVQGSFESMVEKVVSKTPITKILEFIGPDGYIGATLKGFSAPTQTVSLVSGQTNIIPLFLIPSLLKGRLTVIGGIDTNKLFLSCDVMWDGTTLTVQNIIKKNTGIFGTPSIINNNGNISLSVYMGGNLSLDFKYDFEGTYYVD